MKQTCAAGAPGIAEWLAGERKKAVRKGEGSVRGAREKRARKEACEEKAVGLCRCSLKFLPFKIHVACVKNA